MILNAEQAKQVWCPMVRASRDEIFSRCIASGCAMWRWIDKPADEREVNTRWSDEDDPVEEPPRPADVPASWAWVPISGEGDDLEGGYWREPQAAADAENAAAVAARRGYCGLAGPIVSAS